MKIIRQIFDRDYDQWLHEMIRNELAHELPKVWGKGLPDQIIHFDGRSARWFRYIKDMDKLREYIAAKPLNSSIFSKKSQDRYLGMIAKMRRLISLPPKKITNDAAHLSEIKQLHVKFYPFYSLGVFLPGPWREYFLQKQGQRGEKVIKLVYRSRVKSEGIQKLIGLHFRAWLGPKLTKLGYPEEYVRILSVKEIDDLVNKDILPKKKILDARAKGFVYQNNKITPTTNFRKYLKDHELEIEQQEAKNCGNSISGIVAFASKEKVKGVVNVVFNTYEIRDFKKGCVLVVPMTSPEYVPYMKQAAAIITDEGGLTCHAAIASRELKKPCIISTKIATKVLKDGDMVEVDANKGMVKKL